jgi:hypothetical protein
LMARAGTYRRLYEMQREPDARRIDDATTSD